MERQINLLKKYGYTNFFILVNYQAQAIKDFCCQAKFDNLNITIIDDGEPLGTAGATLKIINQLEKQVLVVYGDTLFDVDLNRFEEYHRQKSSIAATLFLHPNDHPADSDLVRLDQSGSIIKFHPYPHPADAVLPNLVNAALYILNTASFKKFQSLPGPLDFAKDLFPLMLNSGEKFLGYSSPEYIKDAGTPERLDRVIHAVESGLVQRSNLTHRQRAVFIDRDGTLNEEIGTYITSPSQLHIYNGIGESIRRLNESEWRTILVTNQPVIARGDCTFEELDGVHAKLETEIAKSKAYFDKIYYCPHHPDKGFKGEIEHLKVRCLCRKPSPGMFLTAKKDLNIDFNYSWHIGDSSADIGAAINAGISSITVETGHGGMDEKYSYQPEFIFPNFSDAVDFILDTYPLLAERLSLLIDNIPRSKYWFIGGLSRSGKTTISSLIKRELRIRQIKCHVISLDRWLLDKASRGIGVWERYDVSEFLKIFAQISSLESEKKITLNLPNYSKIHNGPLREAEKVEISDRDIVIFEGVIANAIANMLELNNYSIYVEIDEHERQLRIAREYIRRGFSPPEISNLISLRENDEHVWVRTQKNFVNEVIHI